MSYETPIDMTPENSDTLRVTVSYLRLDRLDDSRGVSPPSNAPTLVKVERPDIGFYRYLYDTVGKEWIWWRRRLMSDVELREHLAHPDTDVHVLYRDGQPHGFFELDKRPRPDIDLAYFGLLPFAVGQGLGPIALRLALDAAWAHEPRAITVNTCTADHPRALGMYLESGFRLLRTADQEWTIPRDLGFSIPNRLRPERTRNS